MKKLSPVDEFKSLCFKTKDEIELFIKKHSLSSGKEYGTLQNDIEQKCIWSPSNICRYCKLEISTIEELAIHYSYWTPHSWYPSHIKCLSLLKNNEIYECQKIDSNCNECKFLERIPFSDILDNDTFKRMKTILWNFEVGKTLTSQGHCLKFNSFAFPSSNSSIGLDCFEHRKDIDK